MAMARLAAAQILAPAVGAASATLAAIGIGLGDVGAVIGALLGAGAGTVLTWRESSGTEPQDTGQDSSTQPAAESFAPIPDSPPDAIRRFSDVMDALPIGLLVVSSDQTIRAANHSIRQTFGLPQEPGYPVETLRARRLLEAIAKVRSSDDPLVFEMTLTRSTHTVLNVYVRPVPASSPSGISMIVAVQDITTERIADELHRDFVANASHELKTPLAVVSGLIETLQGPAKDDPVGTERFLGRLDTQVRRMTRLINDLMSLNRIELNERVLPEAPENLADLVSETVDALRPVAEASNVQLFFHDIDDQPRVMAEREELGQLFGNLIDNAIKYGGVGKEVHIRLCRAEEPNEIGVAIEDQGAGIEREHLPRLTERFYRVDIGRSREKGGTGLGLAICKHIVNRHRGRLDIDSTLGEGSVFTVWLPCRFSNQTLRENLESQPVHS